MTIRFADRCALGFIVLGLALLPQTVSRADEDNCGLNCNEIDCWVYWGNEKFCYGLEKKSCAPCEYGRCVYVVTTTPKCINDPNDPMNRYYYGKDKCTTLCTLAQDDRSEAVLPNITIQETTTVYRSQCKAGIE